MVFATILILEDDPNDVELLQAHLDRQGFRAELVVVAQLEAFRQRLAIAPLDIVLTDYSLPGCTGLDAIDLVQQVCPDIPCILISGVLGEERAVEALQRGATDYVLKQRLDRLVPALGRALAEKQQRLQLREAAEALRKSEEQFRTSVENMQDCFAILRPKANRLGTVTDLTMEYLNPAALNYLGFSRLPQGMTLLSAIPLFKSLRVFEQLCSISRWPQQSLQEEVRLQSLGRPAPTKAAPATAKTSSSGLFDWTEPGADPPEENSEEDLEGRDLLNQQCIALDIRAVSLSGDRLMMTWRDVTQQQQHSQEQAKALKQFQRLHRAALSERHRVLDSLSQEIKIAIASVHSCTHLLQLEQLSSTQQQQVLSRLQQCSEHLSQILDKQQTALATQPHQAEAHLLSLLEQQPEQQPEQQNAGQPEQQNTRQHDSIQLDGLRVLIIDDLDDACEVAKLSLEIYGAEVEVSLSAAEGMAKLADYRPDVLVVDIQMPDQDGYSFIRQLRNLEDRALSLIPAIAFTADALASDRRKAILAGFQLHVSKPIDIEQLARAVGAVASQNRSLGR